MTLQGMDNVAMMRTPDRHGRLELLKFHRLTAARAVPMNAPANTLGIRRIMFAVEEYWKRAQPLAAEARLTRALASAEGSVR
jgi:hypothetical protein